jgi:hypothetical protein
MGSAPDPVRESAAQAIAAALGLPTSGRPADWSFWASQDMTIGGLVDALTAAGYRLAGPGEVVVRLPESNCLRPSANPYALPLMDRVNVRWSGSTLAVDQARQLVADVLASIDAIELATSPAEPTVHPVGG